MSEDQAVIDQQVAGVSVDGVEADGIGVGSGIANEASDDEYDGGPFTQADPVKPAVKRKSSAKMAGKKKKKVKKSGKKYF